MDSFWVALTSAFWFGILTSISPCPLAANIAAVTYIGKRVDRPVTVFISGLAYTTGRTITYILLAFIVISSILAIPDLAMFLQRYMNKVLGPILILAGIFLLNVINISMPGIRVTDKLQKRVENSGIWGAGLLGLLLALSFCPVSAALYFGSLIPLSVEQNSIFWMPAFYGIGTSLPVVGFSILIAFSTKLVSSAYTNLTIIGKYARIVTGIIFILIGIYYILEYIFLISIF